MRPTAGSKKVSFKFIIGCIVTFSHFVINIFVCPLVYNFFYVYQSVLLLTSFSSLGQLEIKVLSIHIYNESIH